MTTNTNVASDIIEERVCDICSVFDCNFHTQQCRYLPLYNRWVCLAELGKAARFQRATRVWAIQREEAAAKMEGEAVAERMRHAAVSS
jgi:hypothetical protein